ncbi:hypothetical protein HD553DRAFT_326361 [Filobasidium floriforme]|uniref:uncharacterized protein n=1 Tax=Filobasidium floriforme TaxID=5210 RepID=UPI001E8DCF68|nr:uncharacterized protein HD553DRAFT_326361 [Filobasidium floriforme]KAH8079631.1 hypothetical protein HD553DRAFT_326361 [Filobasidium floriforme]
MSFELSCSDQDDNVSRSTVFDGDTSTVLSQALSIQSQMTADEAADQQYSSLSLGKKRYRTEELPRAGVMKPKTPGKEAVKEVVGKEVVKEAEVKEVAVKVVIKEAVREEADHNRAARREGMSRSTCEILIGRLHLMLISRSVIHQKISFPIIQAEGNLPACYLILRARHCMNLIADGLQIFLRLPCALRCFGSCTRTSWLHARSASCRLDGFEQGIPRLKGANGIDVSWQARLTYPDSRSSVSCFIDVYDFASAVYAPHIRNKAKPRGYAILLVSFELFEKEGWVEVPGAIFIEQVSFVYLGASFLVFCPSQQEDAHLRVNVAVDVRGACDRSDSDLEDHKKTRKDVHTIAWKKLPMGCGRHRSMPFLRGLLWEGWEALMLSQTYSCREDDDDSRSRGDTYTTIATSSAPSASFNAASSLPREYLSTRGQQSYNANDSNDIAPARGSQYKGTGRQAPATKPKDPPQGTQVDQPRDGGDKPTEGNVGGQAK